MFWRRSFLAILISLVSTHTAAQADPYQPAAVGAGHVPPIPEPLWQELARYQDIRAAAFAGFSPTEDGLLIRTRFGETTQLHRVYEPGGRREQVTFQTEPVTGTFVEHAD